MGSKPKICKCGHKKDTHKNKPDSKLSFAGHCNKCKCNSYLNRNKPFKSDIALTITCTVMFLVIAGTFIYSSVVIGEISEPIKDELSTLTVGDLNEFMNLLMFAGLAIFFVYFVLYPISSDYSNKKRKSFPVEDES